MSYIHYLCLFAYSGIQHILGCVLDLLDFVLCLVYPLLQVSLDCPLLIAHSVFSNVYIHTSTYDKTMLLPPTSTMEGQMLF